MSTGLRRSIATLIARGLVEETDQQVGVTITDAGRAAIGAPVRVLEPVPPAAPPQASVTKIALVTGLLRRPDGATVAELTAATGWLPHTTRAALTGLRKKGHDIAKVRRDDVTVYCIAQVA